MCLSVKSWSYFIQFFRQYREYKHSEYYDKEMQSRKNTSKSENLFEDQKGVEDTSIMNSNGIFYLNYTTNSTMNQHSSFNFEVYFDDMHHLEEENKKVGKIKNFTSWLLKKFDELRAFLIHCSLSKYCLCQ